MAEQRFCKPSVTSSSLVEGSILEKDMLRKMLFLLPMFVTFGLGSAPDMNPLDGGLIVIGFYEQKPAKKSFDLNRGIVLFDFEM